MFFSQSDTSIFNTSLPKYFKILLVFVSEEGKENVRSRGIETELKNISMTLAEEKTVGIDRKWWKDIVVAFCPQ